MWQGIKGNEKATKAYASNDQLSYWGGALIDLAESAKHRPDFVKTKLKALLAELPEEYTRARRALREIVRLLAEGNASKAQAMIREVARWLYQEIRSR